MQAKPLLAHILEDEALTRGLGDAEARVLVEWLVEQAERLAASGLDERPTWQTLTRLCQRGRAIGRFVTLWCSPRTRGSAIQLAAVERFPWPLPCTGRDPCELMQTILQWESQALAA